MAKQKVNLDHIGNVRPASSMDELLLGPTTSALESQKPVAEEAPAKIRFTNALPSETFRRLQQYSFWSHDTIGDILDEAIQAYLQGKPDADRPIPAKQAARRRLG